MTTDPVMREISREALDAAASEIDRLRSVNAELLAAAKKAADLLHDLISSYSDSPGGDFTILRQLEVAIVHAKEPAP